jgi:hypothetical protein
VREAGPVRGYLTTGEKGEARREINIGKVEPRDIEDIGYCTVTVFYCVSWDDSARSLGTGRCW